MTEETIESIEFYQEIMQQFEHSEEQQRNISTILLMHLHIEKSLSKFIVQFAPNKDITEKEFNNALDEGYLKNFSTKNNVAQLLGLPKNIGACISKFNKIRVGVAHKSEYAINDNELKPLFTAAQGDIKKTYDFFSKLLASPGNNNGRFDPDCNHNKVLLMALMIRMKVENFMKDNGSGYKKEKSIEKEKALRSEKPDSGSMKAKK